MHHPTFSDMYDEAARHPDYWAELTMLSFSEDMLEVMQAKSVTRPNWRGASGRRPAM